MEVLCYIVGFVFLFSLFFCLAFDKKVSNYINACAEAKRKQQERFKWIDEWLKKEVGEDYDTD